MHIPDDPLYYEKFYFTPGDLGFRTHETKYGKIGALVCWDQWFPEAARLTALSGAQFLFYPTAIGWLPNEKPEMRRAQHSAWETIQRAHAIANGVYVAVRSTGQAHRGGVLRIASANEFDFVDPALAYSPDSWAVLAITNDGLVAFRRVGGIEGSELVPDLAASLPEPEDAGKTYTFRLRPDIHYSHRHAATWLSWPKDPETWPDRVPQVEEIFLQMMAALAPYETVNLLVDDAVTEASVRERCKFAFAENIRFHQIATVDSWIRDYGPNFLINDSPMSDKLQFVADSVIGTGDKLKFVGHLAYNDWIFNAWGNKYEELKKDNAIPSRLEGI